MRPTDRQHAPLPTTQPSASEAIVLSLRPRLVIHLRTRHTRTRVCISYFSYSSSAPSITPSRQGCSQSTNALAQVERKSIRRNAGDGSLGMSVKTNEGTCGQLTVHSVQPFGPAQLAGVRRGHVILESETCISLHPVQSPSFSTAASRPLLPPLLFLPPPSPSQPHLFHHASSPLHSQAISIPQFGL